MNEESLTVAEQVKELENFIFDNPELEKLEAIVDKFNIFSSLGIINQEIRHSHFLAWLLDPGETHNLSDYFTTSFLKLATYNSTHEHPELTLIDIDTLDLSNMQVLREWKNIDVLLVDEEQKLVFVIENKVDSKEHSNQLNRYRKTVESTYPDYRKLYIYLTVSGEEPESEDIYIPISYREVSTLIETLLDRKASQLNEEITIFIRHYNEMIKRYIMEESEVQELCEQLYKKHKKALDLIFMYKPDVRSDIRDVLGEIVDADERMEKDTCNRSHVRFIPKNLDFLPKKSEGWTKSKRMVLFEFRNYDKALSFVIVIGPGEESIRESVFNHVKGKPYFHKTKNGLKKKWVEIYSKKIATFSSLEEKSREEIRAKILSFWKRFLAGDYKLIEKDLLALSGD
jgi:hypothetical protein